MEGNTQRNWANCPIVQGQVRVYYFFLKMTPHSVQCMLNNGAFNLVSTLDLEYRIIHKE